MARDGTKSRPSTQVRKKVLKKIRRIAKKCNADIDQNGKIRVRQPEAPARMFFDPGAESRLVSHRVGPMPENDHTE